MKNVWSLTNIWLYHTNDVRYMMRIFRTVTLSATLSDLNELIIT